MMFNSLGERHRRRGLLPGDEERLQQLQPASSFSEQDDLSWSLNLTQGPLDFKNLGQILGHILLPADNESLLSSDGDIIGGGGDGGIIIGDGDDPISGIDFGMGNETLTTHLLDDLIYNYESLRTGISSRRRTGNLFEFVVEGILLTGVSLFGLLGNTIAIVVLSRPSMKGSFSTLLIGLSLFDMLYLSIGIALFGLPSISSDYCGSTLYLQILQFCYGLGHIGRVGSVFVTMSVTVERYFAIVHPLKHFKVKKFLLLISTVVSVVYNVPRFFEMERKVYRTPNGSSKAYISQSPLRNNPHYVTYYIFWSKFVFVEVIPYFTILVLNSLIIGKILKSNKFRKRFVDGDLDPEATSRQRRETNLGVVLISISVLFILCQSVKIIPDFYEVVFCSNIDKCPKSFTKTVMESLIDLSHLLLAINSSANFILYTWRGEKFRETLTTTLHLQRCLPRYKPSRFRRGCSRRLSSIGGGGGCHSIGTATLRPQQTEVTEAATSPNSRTKVTYTCRVVNGGGGGGMAVTAAAEKAARKAEEASSSSCWMPMTAAVSVYDLHEKRERIATSVGRAETSV